HEGVVSTAKRVAIVGTGSTGIQATPVIAEDAEHLYVFQRTPNYSIPARNYALTAERMAEIKTNYAEIRRMARESYGGFPYEMTLQSAMDVSAEERLATYARLWCGGG